MIKLLQIALVLILTSCGKPKDESAQPFLMAWDDSPEVASVCVRFNLMVALAKRNGANTTHLYGLVHKCNRAKTPTEKKPFLLEIANEMQRLAEDGEIRDVQARPPEYL